MAEQKAWAAIPAAVENFVYDGAGRLVADGIWTYTWDAGGHLTQMMRKPGTSLDPALSTETISYGYDCDGRRTQRTNVQTMADASVQTKTSKVLWDGWQPVCEERTVNGTSLAKRWFVWGADVSGSLGGAGGIGGLVSIREEGGRTLLPVDDGLGNIMAVVDGAGATIASYSYGPYGEDLGSSGEVDACPFGYQSKWRDAEAGLSYFGYRHYSPRLGRWLSRDPLGEKGGMNLYAYCEGDPVNKHDYLGMDTVQGNGAVHTQKRMFMAFAQAMIGRAEPKSAESAIAAIEEWAGGDVLNEADRSLVYQWYGNYGYPGFYQRKQEAAPRYLPVPTSGPAISAFDPNKPRMSVEAYDTRNAAQAIGRQRGMEFMQPFAPSDHAAMLGGSHFYEGAIEVGKAFAGGKAISMGISGITKLTTTGLAAFETTRPLAAAVVIYGSEIAPITGRMYSLYEAPAMVARTAEIGETALLERHLKNSIARFEAEGFTAEQTASIVENSALAAAHRGTQIDTFFKDAISLDPRLGHLELTPRYKFGPDVFNPSNQTWWDVTTPAQWDAHVRKYWLFGDGVPLFTK